MLCGVLILEAYSKLVAVNPDDENTELKTLEWKILKRILLLLYYLILYFFSSYCYFPCLSFVDLNTLTSC